MILSTISEIYLEVFGTFDDVIEDPVRKDKATKPRKSKSKEIVTVRYYINRANGYTLKVPAQERFAELMDGLIDMGYVECSKDEYEKIKEVERRE